MKRPILCFALLFAGCGSQSGGGASVDSYCKAICGRATTCDSKQDLATCTNSCNNNYGVALPKLRIDFIQSVQSCLERKDCKEVLSGAESACFREASASMSPTSSASTFCSGSEVTSKRCGGSFDNARCLEGSKIFADETIGSAKACNDKNCDQISACTNSAFATASVTSGASFAPVGIGFGSGCEDYYRCFGGALTAEQIKAACAQFTSECSSVLGNFTNCYKQSGSCGSTYNQQAVQGCYSYLTTASCTTAQANRPTSSPPN